MAVAVDRDRVAIVVSSEAAPSVARLARECPVWAVRTPETESVARHARRGGADVTLFAAGAEPESSLLSIIDEVELHHGALSHPDAPVGVIQVVGTSATDAIRDMFQSLGFTRLDSAPGGFVACRS
jgi:hypothetical protein